MSDCVAPAEGEVVAMKPDYSQKSNFSVRRSLTSNDGNGQNSAGVKQFIKADGGVD